MTAESYHGTVSGQPDASSSDTLWVPMESSQAPPDAQGLASLGDDCRIDESRTSESLRRALLRASLFPNAEPPRVGRYRVLNVIGEGGMGTVFSGLDERLDRKVALKLLRDEHDQQSHARVLREARALARVSHPNVVSVFEVGEHAGVVFVAMEYVRGESLARWSPSGPARRHWTQVLDLYIQAGRGLGAVHAAGLVHRDFKPHNAMLGEDGRVRVLDFGLVATRKDVFGPTETDLRRADDVALTQTGAVMGTPAYMPPEAIDGGTNDARSDQFSFCVALWEALFNVRPFQGSTPLALLQSIEAAAIELPEGNRVPVALRRIIERGLRRAPSERWPDMSALLGALEHVRSRSRRRILAGVVAVAVGASAAAVFQQRHATDASERAAQAREASQVSKAGEARAEEAATSAAVAARNALHVTQAALARGPTEAAALLREVVAENPETVEGWSKLAGSLRNAPRNLRAVLHGHRGTVYGSTFVDDGHSVATAGLDGTVRLYRLDDPNAPRILGEHAGMVWSIQSSPDGRSVVTASFDNTAMIFDVRGASPQRVLRGHAAEIFGAVFSPDGHRVVTASHDGTARVFRASDGVQQVVLNHPGRVLLARFTPDGESVVTACVDNLLRIFDLDDPVHPRRLHGPTARIATLDVSADGRWIASGGYDNVAHLYALDAKAPRERVVARHDGAINTMEFSPDGTRLLTGSEDATARLVDLEAEVRDVVLTGHVEPVRSVRFSPDGTRVATASNDGTVRTFTLDGAPVSVFAGHADHVRSVAYAPSGSLLVTASSDATARVFSTQEQRGRPTYARHRRPDWAVDVFPDGHHFVTAGDDGLARVFALADDEPVAAFDPKCGPLYVVAVSPRGDSLVVGCATGDVLHLDAADGSRLQTLHTHPQQVSAISHSADGRSVASTSQAGDVHITHLSDTRPGIELPRHPRNIRSATFSSNGDHLLTSCSDGVARIHDMQGTLVTELRGHRAAVYAANYHPDGQRVATGSADGVVRLFDLDDPTRPRELPGHSATITAVEFSADGQLLATCSLDATVRLHRVDRGQPSEVVALSDRELYDLRFTVDGGSIVTVGARGQPNVAAATLLGSQLRATLWADPFCHRPQTRRRLLAETSGVARANYERCQVLTDRCRERPSVCAASIARAFGSTPP